MAFSSKALFGINRARAAASSANFNPRNLEFLWYPFWNRVASRIAAKIDIERCAVGPQYPLWRLWSEDEEDLGQIFIIADGTDNVDMEEAEDDDMEDTEDNTGDLGDITLSTINETLLDKARSRITDFALLYWIENARINVYRDDEADELFAIEREYIPILIEVKRAPSRKLEGNDRATKFNRLMFRAQEDVFRQVSEDCNSEVPRWFTISPYYDRHYISSQAVGGAISKVFSSLRQ